MSVPMLRGYGNGRTTRGIIVFIASWRRALVVAHQDLLSPERSGTKYSVPGGTRIAYRGRGIFSLDRGRYAPGFDTSSLHSITESTIRTYKRPLLPRTDTCQMP